MKLSGKRVDVYILVHKETGNYFICYRRANTYTKAQIVRSVIQGFNIYRSYTGPKIANLPMSWFARRYTFTEKDFVIRKLFKEIPTAVVRNMITMTATSLGTAYLLNNRVDKGVNTHPAMKLDPQVVFNQENIELEFPAMSYDLKLLMKGTSPSLNFYRWVQ